jgi:hypothetical protein
MFKRNLALYSALLAFALLAGQVARADDAAAVTLGFKPKLGRVSRSKTVIKTTVMGMDVIVNQTQKSTVKEVKENGDFILEVVDEGSTINIGGTEQDQPAGMPRTITRDKFGKVKEAKEVEGGGFMAPEISKLMTLLSTSIFADKAVKVDDTWQTELENPAVKEKKVTVKDTFLGIEKIDGKEYWKIKQTADAVLDADGSKMTYSFTAWLNPVDGEAFKVEGTVKDVPTQVGALTMEITSKSLPANDKEKPVKKDN